VDVLLDTQVVLWWLAEDPRLSETMRAHISDPSNQPVVSAASAWEVAIKQALGKLKLDGDLEDSVGRCGFRMLPVTFAHAVEVRTLPSIHRDPFDRMLIAQARVENLPLLTADRRLAAYPANVLCG
jgi:PIN domain nuclease of toxin-antitoxin system